MGISSRSCLALLLGVIVGAATSEKCGSLLDGQLLVAGEGTIWRLRTDGEEREAYASASNPIKLAYSHARSTLYYSDLNERKVFALKDGSATAARMVVAPPTGQEAEQWLPWGIGLDERNDKLYMLEAFTGALHAYDLATGRSSVVISANVTGPKDVEIDADEGYLFVLDSRQILRAELDGSNPKPIYEELASLDELLEKYPSNLLEVIIGSAHPAPDRSKLHRLPINIAELTIDTRAKRLYWVDTKKRSVESSDYEGRDRRVHFHDNDTSIEGSPEPFAGLAFADRALYWADDMAHKVFRIDEAGAVRVIASGIDGHAVAAPSCGQRPTSDNPCTNAPCQQLCLLSRSSRTGYKCACEVGLELAADGKSCDAVRDFILFAQDGYLRGHSLSKSGRDVIDPSRFSVGQDASIDVDVEADVVYYSSSFPHDQLHALDLKTGSSKILSPDLLSKNSGDLAYDWTTGNLYYLTYYYADVTTLSVTRVDDPTSSKVLVMNVPRLVRGLVVHPRRGYVFFANLDVEGGRGSISRIATDGTGLRMILDLGRVVSVDALALDYDEDRIYWSETRDSGNVVVRHANLDGEDARTLSLPNGLEDVNELAIDAKHVYGINEEQLFRATKSGERAEVLVRGEQLDGLKLVSHSLQRPEPHPCESRGCSKFCFGVPSDESGALRASCGCPYGEKLADDGISCVDNSKAEPAFLPCKYTSFKCNMQTEKPEEKN